jgi:hypothetical protein
LATALWIHTKDTGNHTETSIDNTTLITSVESESTANKRTLFRQGASSNEYGKAAADRMLRPFQLTIGAARPKVYSWATGRCKYIVSTRARVLSRGGFRKNPARVPVSGLIDRSDTVEASTISSKRFS